MRKGIVILISIIFCFGCKKDKVNPPSNPIIETPSSWLSAKIGEDYIFNADTNKTTIDTQIRLFTEIFSYDIDDRILALRFEGRDTGTYILGTSGSRNYLRYLNQNGQVFSSINNSGILYITKYDTINKRMSGNFKDLLIRLSPPYDNLEVKDGKFENLKITAFQ